MRLVAGGVEVEVDNRHIKHPAMWVLQYVFGPATSAAPGPDGGGGERAPVRTREALPEIGPQGDT